jgi:hypothetical protein
MIQIILWYSRWIIAPLGCDPGINAWLNLNGLCL